MHSAMADFCGFFGCCAGVCYNFNEGAQARRQSGSGIRKKCARFLYNPIKSFWVKNKYTIKGKTSNYWYSSVFSPEKSFSRFPLFSCTARVYPLVEAKLLCTYYLIGCTVRAQQPAIPWNIEGIGFANSQNLRVHYVGDYAKLLLRVAESGRRRAGNRRQKACG